MSSGNRGYVLVTALLVLIILTAVNLLASRYFSRLDLTENREYTISSSTRDVLAGLDDVVNVKVYFSRNLPPYLANLDRQVKDLLDEYVARGKGNLQVQYLDPEAEPQGERALQMLGIPKVQLNVIQKDKAEVTGVYLGIAVQRLDRTEVLPVVQGTANLEYDLTSTILKVTAEPRTVGVATAGETTLQNGLKELQRVLQRQYAVQEVDLATPVPESVTTLIVIDAAEFSPEALFHADQFLMRGGSLMVLTSGVDIPEGGLLARDRSVSFGDLLRDYGVEIENALVADGQAAMASFSEGYMTFTVPYPWWPKVTAEGLSRENPVTAGLDALVFPWVSPLKTIGADGESDKAPEVSILARSSPRSTTASAPYNLNPNSRVNAAPGDLDARILALALTGSFSSHWGEGSAVPGDSLGTAPPPVTRGAPARLLVVGNWRFATDRFLQQFSSNAIFLANAVDWMTLGTELISIRSRGAAGRPLREVEDAERNALKLSAILGVPILVVLGGLVRARARQSRRRREAREYGGAA